MMRKMTVELSIGTFVLCWHVSSHMLTCFLLSSIYLAK